MLARCVMKHSSSYIVSFILAMLVHAGVIALILVHWASGKETARVKLDGPYYIASYALSENPLKAKQAREANAAKARRDKLKHDRLKRAADKAARVNRKRLETERLRLAAEKKAAAARRLAAEKDKKNKDAAAQAQQLLEQEIATAIAFEQGARQAVTDAEKISAYAYQIKIEIRQHWSRPPSARNGMEAILRVFLLPTGAVVNVVVQDSSGNEAFDRSVILAVEKVGQFIVPKDNRQFERYFREFEVKFRPEDLRL